MNLKSAFLLFALLPGALYAQENNHSQQKFYLNTSVGYLAGNAPEYVFDPNTGSQLSHLVWRMQDAPIIRAQGAFQINSWFEASLNGWINLTTGNALMDDYDWFPPIVPFAMWSHHPDTDLQQANEVDLNLKAWVLQNKQFQLGGVLGYQRNLYSFAAKGGCYSYYYGAVQGCFPEGEVVIGYKQTFNMPYIGIAAQYAVKAWELTGLFKYSNQVAARDIDQHYSRTLSFYESSNKFESFMLNINLGYYIKPQIKLFTEGLFNDIPKRKTGTVIIDQSINDRQDITGEAAALSNRNYILSFGIQYTGLDI